MASKSTNRPAQRGSTSCFACQNRSRSEWCQLQPADLVLLDQIKVCNSYRPGQVIFYQGNPSLGIYCIEDGTIAIRKSDADGNSMIVRLAHPGQTIGYRAYFSREPYSASAEALSLTRICFIERTGVSRLLEHNPSLGLSFLKRMADDLRQAEDSRLQAAAVPVRSRIIHLLLTLKERFSEIDVHGKLTIHLPLARQDIASMVGTRPETVARAVRALQDDGLAEFRGRRVVLLNMEALLDEVEASY